MEYKDYYQILGVDKSADQDEIKKAYRRLARKYHPDVSQEADAENQFKEIKEAYEVLGDPEKRKKYDTLGSQWQGGDPFGAGGFDPRGSQADFGNFSSFTHTFDDADFDQFSDFFAEMFGGGRSSSKNRHDPFGQGFADQFNQQQRRPQKGQDLNTELTIALQEALKGTERNLKLKTRQGAKSLKAKIPAGIQEGQQVRLKGQGGAGQHGGPKGDLLVKVHIKVPKDYAIKDQDIYQYVPITPWEAALGDKIKVNTLHGRINVSIPAGSQTGKTLRFSGKGLPKSKTKKGDYLVVLQIQVPPAKTEEEKQFYQDMKQKMPFNPRQASTD